MSLKSSSLERNIITNPSEGMLQPVKASSSKSTKSPLPLEPFFTRKIPVWKRTTDIIGSIMGLLLFSPLILAIAIAIKLTSKGPIFFAQERTGQNLDRFEMYKFRTMIDGADKQLDKIRDLNQMSGPLIKMEKDPRLTPIGGLLRKTSLDELPQLINT
ncbi:MAG: sugar transferase [Deltaproteobacteria bacterium]|nr:sugar transferase [Deltaproteobacteria bacterium]